VNPTQAYSSARQINPNPDDEEDQEVDVSGDESDEGPHDFEEHDDGSITMYDDDGGDYLDQETDFDANLAEIMDENERKTLAMELIEDIERWRKEREPRDKKFSEGIKRTGMGEAAPGGAPFDGASEVTHPILLECAVDFQASVMKELFPPSGPVRIYIPGKMKPDKRKKAERKRDHMNWQLTEEIEEYRSELEVLTMQLPIIGDGYQKFYFDPNLGRVATEYISDDCIISPFSAKTFYTDDFAHMQYYTDQEVEMKVENGDWLDIDSPAPGSIPDKTKTQEAQERVEGKEEMGMNEEGIRTVYELYAIRRKFDFDDKSEGKSAAYIIVVDEQANDIRSIRRNWDEKDQLRRKLDHIVQYKFFPWKGTKGIGFVHLIGSMAAAMTGSLRALLDTAHINNFPSLLKLKSKVGGQNIQLEATGVTEIEGSTPTDDIRKIIMPVPFNPPSPVLFQLLGFLDTAAKGVVATAEEKIADASNNGPVGTTLALIEQGSKVYSNIHSRMHYSQKKSLSIIHRLNKYHLDDKITIEELGDLIIYRKDYEGPMDVIPVSDPNVFCETQRYAQLQAVRQLKTEDPDLFNRRALVKRELEQLRIPDYEELLVPEPEQKKANPVAENIAMAMGKPAFVFPDQDHISHCKVLMAFMTDTNLGASPLIAPGYMQLALKHLHDHVVMWYGSYMYDTMKQIIGPEVDDMMQQDELAPKIDRILSLVAGEAHGNMKQILDALPPVIQQAQQLIQQYAPKPQDPMSREVDRKSQRDQGELQIKGAQLQLKGKQADTNAQSDQTRAAIAGQEVAVQREIADNKNATELQRTTQDNMTAVTIAHMDNEAHKDSALKDGASLG
jgi:hypothetical protein